MDQIKDAFNKVKEEMNLLKKDITKINQELNNIQNILLELFKSNYFEQNSGEIPSSTHNIENKTIQHINSTHLDIPTHPSTHKLPFKDFKSQNIYTSIGNGGVPTDRQTDRQTDKQEGISSEKPPLDPLIILDQLDNIKKELRLKIKKLTNQEMLVLSYLYQLEDQGYEVTYNSLSVKLHLSESSVRDYIQRIINKGIPLTKEKINNKQIMLHIPYNFKRLASLNTLIHLREL